MLPSFLNNSYVKAAIRLAPNSFKKYGVPRGIESFKNLNPLIIYPGSIIKSSSPKTIFKEIHPKFSEVWLSKLSSEAFILCLDSGISSSYGANLTKDGKVIAEVSTRTGLKLKDIKKHKVFNEVAIASKAKKYECSIATLTTSGQHNYYHWLFNALPKIHLLDKSGIKYNKIYVEVKNNVQEETLKILGYESEKIINSSTIDFLSASQLIVPSLPDYKKVGNITAWSCNFLRQKFLNYNIQESKFSNRKYRRIYISRVDARYRKVVNELEFIRFLESYGFSVIQTENLSFLDQVNLFRDAEVVIAPHGAGLSNLVFCQKGVKVVEIFSSVYVIPCYWILSQHIGLDYYYLIGEDKKQSEDSSPNSKGSTSVNFEVDLDKLRKTFELASIGQ